jgi:predicted TPR repeat methyltransferase
MATMTLQQAFDLAVQRHRAGQLLEAQHLYRHVLVHHPNHAGALHYLGVIAHQAGRTDIAVDFIQRAIVQAPGDAGAYSDLGNALKDGGKLDAGIAAYRKAIALRPDYAEAHSNLGNALVQKGHLDEAIAACRRALAIKGELPEAWYNLGNALRRSDQLDAAADAYRQAVHLRPDYCEAQINLGNALLVTGQLDEAVAASRRAIAVKPQFPEAQRTLGVALMKKGLLDEAIVACRASIALRSGYAEAHASLGEALLKKAEWDEAIAAYREAVRLKPDSPDWRFILAALTGDSSMPTAPPRYLQGFFDSYAPGFDRHLLGKLAYRVPELLLEAVLSMAPGRKFDVLDLGCGTGLCGVQFRPHARGLVGVDLSPKMLQKAAERNIYDRLVNADILAALDERPVGCDLILAGDVFIYVGDLAAVFAAVARALRPAGFFAFSIERHDGSGFVLQTNCRFAHSLSYVREFAQKHGLAEIHAEEIVLRKEDDADVPGWIVVLSKPESGLHPQPKARRHEGT